ncbi:MAG: SpaA isopeptide-forming pilin-related protein [Eubacteriales bacterium]|nr:SpaA isopeptide-forming pilin-related protein [Eubacteriales bacterium]
MKKKGVFRKAAIICLLSGALAGNTATAAFTEPASEQSAERVTEPLAASQPESGAETGEAPVSENGTEPVSNSEAESTADTEIYPADEGDTESTEKMPDTEENINIEENTHTEESINTEESTEETETGAEGNPEEAESETEDGWEGTDETELWETDFGDEFLEEELWDEVQSGLENETESEAGSECICVGQEEAALLHHWKCPVFTEELLKRCDCGQMLPDILDHAWDCAGVLDAFEAVCSEECDALRRPAAFHYHCEVLNRIREQLCTCQTLETDFELHGEDCGYRIYMEDCSSSFQSVAQMAMDIPTNRLPYSGSGFTAVTADTKTHSEYMAVRFYPGISSMSLWGTPGQNLVKGGITINGTAQGEYWFPTAKGLNNTFGARYSKVAWENGQWYDLLITVAGYTDSVTTNDGKGHTAYPEIGFSNSRILFYFYRCGFFVLRCQIVKTGTSTAVKKKIRLNITDIDDLQMVYFKVSGGGTADYKYVVQNCVVSHDTGKAVAGISGMERLLGDDIGLDDSDHRGDAIYELNTSECYLGVGYSDNELASWNLVQSRMQEAASGTIRGFAVIGIKTDSTITPTAPATPVKHVSSDGQNWGFSNALASANSEYQYRITQCVPMEFDTYFYDTFVLSDTLPEGVDYIGGAAVVRAEDGSNVSSWFDFNAEKGVITATAKASALSSQSFYGYTYYFTFRVKLNPSRLTASQQGNRLTYTVTNKAKARVRHRTEQTDTAVDSNSVTTTASFVREVCLHVTKTDKDTKENIDNAGFEVFEWDGSAYSVNKGRLTYDKAGGCYVMEHIGRTAANKGKYKIKETQIPRGYCGAWEQEFLVPETEGVVDLYYHVTNEMAKGTITVHKTDARGKALQGAVFEITARKDVTSVQGKLLAAAGTSLGKITSDQNGTAVSGPLYPGEYLVTEVTAPAGYDREEQAREVTVAWKNELTPMVNVEISVVNQRAYAKICLIKEIDAGDIVWAHGNPTFTFCLEGEDVLGETHTYYETVEFTQENSADSADSGRIRLTAEFRVPVGTYRASEEKTARYTLQEIYDVTAGKGEQNSVVFDVTEARLGEAVFYNKKVTDQGESHSAFVRNTIG